MIRVVFIRFMLGAVLALCAVLPLSAAEVKNLRTGQQGDQAFAVYDLYGKPGEKEAEVKVVLEIGSEKYAGNRLSLSGDFGKGVKVGVGRKITWDLLKDMPAGFEGVATWDVDVLVLASPGVTTAGPEFTDATIGMEFVPVPGGCFKMGDNFGDGDEDEKPVHEVCLDAFYIGKYEVTQGQWLAIMGKNPSQFKQCGKNCPVENVSWQEIQLFVKKLNVRSDKNYRLPTEAEFEFAARDGGRRERYSGIGESVSSLAWFEANSGGKTHPVGQKKPNSLGVYDMSGNVAEWVFDRKGDYKAENKKNPIGPDSGVNRVLRGGSWLDKSTNLRASSRSELTPSVRTNFIGFRLVLSTTP